MTFTEVGQNRVAVSDEARRTILSTLSLEAR